MGLAKHWGSSRRTRTGISNPYGNLDGSGKALGQVQKNPYGNFTPARESLWVLQSTGAALEEPGVGPRFFFYVAIVTQHGAAGTARAHIRHARGCSHSTWLHSIRALVATRSTLL